MKKVSRGINGIVKSVITVNNMGVPSPTVTLAGVLGGSPIEDFHKH
jgi:hypothetical protein